MSRTLHSDAQALRDFITAKDSVQYALLPEGVVALTITHSNLNVRHVDIRLDLHLSITEVKEKLYTHCGTPPIHQRVYLKQDDQIVCELEDQRMLGYYSVESGMTLHVVDTDPFSMSRNGGLEDVSQIDKYVMSEEDYDTRQGTLRAWIRKKRAEDPTFKMKTRSGPGSAADDDASNEPPPGPESIEHVTVGSRCEVMPGARRGTARFVGEVTGLNGGFWVGVRLDEPLGKSDGVVKDVTYFDCPPNYGAFVRGRNVIVGDFPMEGLGSDDEFADENKDYFVEEPVSVPVSVQAPKPSKADQTLSSTTKAMLARARMDNNDLDDDEDEI